MFEKMREPLRVHSGKKLVYIFVFGLICLMFVFTGLVPDRGGINAPGTAATVNHAVISAQDFQEEVNRYENQMGSTHNMPAAQRQMQEQRIRENVMQRLVAYELVFQSAQGVGIMPTESSTREYIVNIPAFQEQGRFDREMYRNFLTNRNMSASEFEAKIQHELILREVSDLFFTAWDTPKILDDLQQEAKDTKLSIQLVKIDPQAIAGSIVSDKDVDDYLKVTANDEKVKTYFNSHKEDFSTPEQVRARHILFKGDGPEVLAKAQALKKTLTPANFADNAKKVSEDEGSKVKGGDLDYFRRGQMVPEFEKVAFESPVGKISDPVKSPFGYHIILVEDKKPASTKNFEESKRTIARQLLADDRREKVNEDLAKALKDKAGLAPLLTHLKLKWQDLGAVSITQDNLEGVAGGPRAGDQVIEAALKLKAGEISPALIRSGSESYIVRLKGVNETADKKPANLDMAKYMHQGQVGEVLDLWAGELRKEARIKFNETLLK